MDIKSILEKINQFFSFVNKKFSSEIFQNTLFEIKIHYFTKLTMLNSPHLLIHNLAATLINLGHRNSGKQNFFIFPVYSVVVYKIGAHCESYMGEKQRNLPGVKTRAVHEKRKWSSKLQLNYFFFPCTPRPLNIYSFRSLKVSIDNYVPAISPLVP